MGNNNKAADEHRLAQNKFDYFFLGVVVGTLALSIQTFDINVEHNSFYLIVLTWLFLIISFLAGIFRQEKILQHLRIQAIKPKEPKPADLSKVFLQKFANEAENAYKLFKWSFFFAIITFALFKVTNVVDDLSFYNELQILFLIISLGLIANIIYSNSMPSRKK